MRNCCQEKSVDRNVKAKFVSLRKRRTPAAEPKRLWYLFFLLLMMVSVSGFSQNFSYYYQGVNFKCKVVKGKVVVTSFDREVNDVVVPAKVIDIIDEYENKTYDVYGVDLFFDGDTYRTRNLVIEEGVKCIYDRCFSLFVDLKHIKIPVSISYIGEKAFRKLETTMVDFPVGINLAAINKGKKVVVKNDNPDKPNLLPKNIPTIEPVVPNNELLLSDVDIDIPKSSLYRKNTFCIIIANENYEEVPSVEFALQDGRVFKKYCINTLGIPEDNIRMAENATFIKMKRSFDWLKTVAEEYGNDANVIFYYAGHGVPDEKDGTAYLLPVDGRPADISTSYKLSSLYSMLSRFPTKSNIVFIDACFSGMKRDGKSLLASSRGVAIKPRLEQVAGNVVVFSAASNEETALPYNAKSHGMFTYFILKKFQETKGNVSLGELYKYVKTNVRQKSIIQNDQLQSPMIYTSAALEEKWEGMKF